MADVETARTRMFSRRELIAISVVSILLIVSGFIIVRSYEKTARFVTEIRLGSNGAGTVFEPFAATLARLQDNILEYPSPELLQKYGLADLRSLVVVGSIDSSTALRLRTISFDRDRKTVEAVHQYLTDQVINSILPLAFAERNRIQSQIDRVKDNLTAIAKQQAEYRAFILENEKVQARLDQLGGRLRDGITRQGPQGQPPKDSPETGASYILLRDIEVLQIISAPLQHAQSRFEEARLEREKADLQADLRRWTSELNRWQEPALARLAVAGKGPYLSSLPGYIVIGLMVGGLVAFLLIWLFRRQTRATAP